MVFGFDPYRFDNDEMREGRMHWVLGEHFGLSMTPRKGQCGGGPAERAGRSLASDATSKVGMSMVFGTTGRRWAR